MPRSRRGVAKPSRDAATAGLTRQANRTRTGASRTTKRPAAAPERGGPATRFGLPRASSRHGARPGHASARAVKTSGTAVEASAREALEQTPDFAVPKGRYTGSIAPVAERRSFPEKGLIHVQFAGALESYRDRCAPRGRADGYGLDSRPRTAAVWLGAALARRFSVACAWLLISRRRQCSWPRLPRQRFPTRGGERTASSKR